MHTVMSQWPSLSASPPLGLAASPSGDLAGNPTRVTVLRLRPRRAWLPRVAEDNPGCGWFESSRELSQGLEVRECPAEALDELMLCWPAAGAGALAQRDGGAGGAW